MNPGPPLHKDPSGLDGISTESQHPNTTPYDYIIVGSGPGGGPLACRLARAGLKVLVLEAGVDPGAPSSESQASVSQQRQAENERVLYHCPGLHAGSTEPHKHIPDANDPAQTSWGFQVRHYSDSSSQEFYYPRASALGGCSAHHAMIAIYGGDYDWQRIADLTGDDSWASGKMRAIYERIVRARYGILKSRLVYLWDWFLNWLDQDRTASARPGQSSWLDVTMTDPKLAIRDHGLMKIITRTIFDEEGLSNKRVLWHWIKRALTGRLLLDLDLNDERTMRESPEGAALVPVSVSREGVRRGPRELLLETRQALLHDADRFAGKLHIATGVFVRRVLFKAQDKDVPRACGVECQQGSHLYEASPFFKPTLPGNLLRVFARREIILCAGTFNTPQILMLSGLGEQTHLRENGVAGIACVEDANGPMSVKPTIHLPGVGQNLLDRCEISVISEMEEPFESLEGAEFDPFAKNDPSLNEWKAEDTRRPRGGIYTTNGAAIAVLKRSCESVFQPDLLIFGFPIAFRGYYKGWSKDLLARKRGDTQKSRNLWSWVILKAYSTNCGSVKLQSDGKKPDPFRIPAINFRYFGDCYDPHQKKWHINEQDTDLAALMYAVRYVRRLNRKAWKLMKDRDPAVAEIEPGSSRSDRSKELQDWIVAEAWGHHAAGTCRIGADPWRADPARLQDEGAVVDSKFCVHGVRGLRVVDASVFPNIPGYFIAVPIYLVSEKAADIILDELSV